MFSISGVKKRKTIRKDTKDIDEDEIAHGGWWCIKNEADLKGGSFAIEASANCYVMALDNGRFTLGVPHKAGEGPSPEEQFVVIKPPDAQWINLKSGYGKYIGVDSKGVVAAYLDAAGAHERWEVVFQDQQTALLGSNGCFLSMESDAEGYLVATNRMAEENEIIKVSVLFWSFSPFFDSRTNNIKANEVDVPTIEGSSKECEMAYVKLYQHSKVRLNPEDKTYVKKAKGEGNLHEVLLDRREKMKADRYCK
ncbi:unnamed protein product [Soboliphyme baturini]|uniref:FRG1-like family protein n=1 Tax=Soboliphyme baturini TaxID=241478 RepID=A0A3P8CEW5_9BILA|nr:unnamed protein product [Soboliphyme baturini]